MTFQPHMPSETELRELAIQIFFEENPEATTNPEEYELRAPEGHYYLEAQRRAMSSIREDLYKALKAYEEETENIIESLKELGEKPEGYATDEELQKQITKLDNKLAQTERKLEAANTNIEHLTAEKARLDELLSKERPEPPPPPEFGALRRREPTEKEKEPDVTEAEVIEPTEEEGPEEPEEPGGPTEKKPKKVKDKIEHKKPRTEVESVSETRPRKTHKVTAIKPTRPQTKFEIANTAIVKLYEDTLSVIEQGIAAGKACGAVGLMSLLMYADFLHGGAYAAPINQRPFHMNEPTKSPYYAGELKNIDASQGFFGWLLSIFGISNPGPYVQEIFLDANVPHVFPKLLSDDAYAAFLFVFAHLTGQDVMQKAGTNLTTMVEAGKKVVETAKEALPSAEDINNLGALFKLLAVAGA